MEKNMNPFKNGITIKSKSQLKDVMDSLYDSKRLINTVLIAYDAGIVSDINGVAEFNCDFESKWCYILMDEYGMTREASQDAVRFWIDQYAVDYLQKKRCRIEEPAVGEHEKGEADTVEGISSDLPPISVLDLNEGDKIDKRYIITELAGLSENGLSLFKFAIRRKGEQDVEAYFEILGEYEGRAEKGLLLMLMVYNADNELIGAECRNIGDESKGRNTFSAWVHVPMDEQISRIRVRVNEDPFNYL